MQIDPALHSKADNYKVLTNLVVPRPIAWVTSQNEGGTINLAPYSFFNALSADPVYLIISVGKRDDGTDKDTARNSHPSAGSVLRQLRDPSRRS